MGRRLRTGDRVRRRCAKALVCRLVVAFLALQTVAGVASAHVRDAHSVVADHLRVEVTFAGPPLPSRVESAAMEEVRAVWAPYGVDVFHADVSDARRDADVVLTVILKDRPNRRLASGALGSIVFRDEEPQPSITMYQDAIDELVSTVTIAGCRSLQWPSAFHDAIVGRVFGRALAHEIGHFLLRARRHSDVGLMRAPHSVPDLVSADRQHFGLSAAQQTRLSAFISTSVRFSPAATQPISTDDR
jgi:hypothetical protein